MFEKSWSWTSDCAELIMCERFLVDSELKGDTGMTGCHYCYRRRDLGADYDACNRRAGWPLSRGTMCLRLLGGVKSTDSGTLRATSKTSF